MESADSYLVADLLAPEGSEPVDRSAVSRMYYGAHHEARDYLRRTQGIINFLGRWDPDQNRRLGVHEVVIDQLESVAPSIADALDELRARRVLADYEIGAAWAPTTRGEARSLVATIRRLFGSA